MSAPDLHPEELLDRERQSALSSEELARLDAHCAVCTECALLRSAGEAFDEARVPNAEDDALALSLVDRLVDDLPVRSRTKAPRWLWIAAAALVLGGASTAAGLGLVQLGIIDVGGLLGPETPAPERREPTPAPVPEVEEDAAVEVVELPVVEIEADASVTPVRRARAADELYADANTARRAGRHREAIRLYRELMRSHPGSREASASRVAMGNLLLHRLRDPRGAVAQFDAYLGRGGGGALAEEARVGRAVALGRLGRRSAERQAWQEVLARHPGSVHADRARRRLEEL